MTNPFNQVGPSRRLTDSELARAIREDIQAELDAINLYQAHIDHMDNEKAKKILGHIRDEEKEHAAELLALLAEWDTTQAEHFAHEMKEYAMSEGKERSRATD